MKTLLCKREFCYIFVASAGALCECAPHYCGDITYSSPNVHTFRAWLYVSLFCYRPILPISSRVITVGIGSVVRSNPHYNEVIMSTLASQITSLAIVYSTFIRVEIKENIKAPLHWPFCGESTGDRWIPLTKGQWRGKGFHLMTPSC